MSTYSVGPGQPYRELHEIQAIGPHDTVRVHCREEPYRSKLTLNYPGITLEAVPGPNGELPVIDGAGAVEHPAAQTFSDDTRNVGLITVCPLPGGEKPTDITIQGFELRNAHPDGNGYTGSDGGSYGWAKAAAGVAIYRAERVAVLGCKITGNGNGVFAKCSGDPAHTVRGLYLGGNWIEGNGVPGSDRQHNSYIEAASTVYEFNHYGSVMDGSAGLNLKDRGAGSVIRCNRFTGYSNRHLDLVEPDDGTELWDEPHAGETFLFGNQITLPLWSPAAAFVRFGTESGRPMERLFMAHNTCVAINRQGNGGRWATAAFKLDGGQEVWAWSNIFHLQSDEPGVIWPGAFVLAHGAGGVVRCGTNWLPYWTDAGAARISQQDRERNWAGEDPGLTDALNEDYRLAPGSLCSHLTMDPTWGRGGVYEPIPAEYAAYLPRHYWADGDWRERSGWRDVGAVGQ